MHRPVTAAIASLIALVTTPAAAQDWVERSNQYTAGVLEMQGAFFPENVAASGLDQFDGQVTVLSADRSQRIAAAFRARIDELAAARDASDDANLAQDLQILIGSLEQDLDAIALSDALELAWYDVPMMQFDAVGGVLDDQVAPERHASAATLLRRYTGLEGGQPPLTEQAKDRFRASIAAGKVGPYRLEVEQAIARVPTLIAGMRELFATYGIEEPEALAAMETQLTEYAAWERAEVLPRARDDYRLPAELYAMNLREIGIDLPPLELVSRAQRGFYETRAQMEALAPLVAAQLGMAETDYPSVIARLKQEPVAQGELEAFYRSVGMQIEDIVRRENIVTLPDYPVAMRLGSEAENASIPAPHMRPPRLIGNTGEQGTFVLTTGDPAAGPDARYDDFNYGAAAWMLSAHEARPGHELQFAQMIARGVSQARVLYAFNSVNAEGWALYAEAEVLPFMPLDGQLIALQSRLLRTSRAMLDPMLNLGLIDLAGARRVLSQEARFSDAAVKQELDRYTFRAPGQAGSYYYGYTQLIELRIAAELALGDDFDRHAFNDFVVGQGLLPPDLLAQAVREQFIPAHRSAN